MKIIQHLSITILLFLATNKILFGAEAPPVAAAGPREVSAAASLSGTVTPSVDDTKKSRAKKKKPTAKRRRRCQAVASAGYRKMLANWRKPPNIARAKYREGLRDLSIYAVNLGERIRFFPYLPDGELDPGGPGQVERIFRDKHSHTEHPIHPRLIKLLYKIADRFNARQVNLISGYRESIGETVESNHTRGRAVDFMIPGTKLAAVAYYAKTLGHVGVGFYPTAGFIHLDVRDGRSYFWVDRSGPGKPSCLVRIQSQFAAKMDRRWKPRSDKPRRHKNKKGRLLGALETKKAQ